jgi:hypothetical protein
MRLVAGLLEHDDGTVPALIAAGTIRADFYEAMQTAPELAGLKSVVFDDPKPMPIARFREVIIGPAARATASGKPLEIEPALADRLVAESGHGADTLPLLALTLTRLYRDYGDDGDLMLAEYERMGGMRRVVQNEVDTLLAAAPEQRQVKLALLRAAFIPWLATINPDNDQPARRIARLSDLPEEARHLIDAMVEKRHPRGVAPVDGRLRLSAGHPVAEHHGRDRFRRRHGLHLCHVRASAERLRPRLEQTVFGRLRRQRPDLRARNGAAGPDGLARGLALDPICRGDGAAAPGGRPDAEHPVSFDGAPAHPRLQLDEYLSLLVRLSIVAALARVDDAEFAAVRHAIEVSDPVLSKQVGILEGASYVSTRKGYVGKRPRTWLSLTDEGRAALRRHLTALHALIADL